MATPLHTVKEKFGSKAQLVDQLIGLVQRQDEESDAELTERLMRVSNRKLITLHERENALKSGFGTREKLVSALVEKKLGRADSDLEAKIGQYSTGRLLSMSRAL
jgi:hypothetical protein